MLESTSIPNTEPIKKYAMDNTYMRLMSLKHKIESLKHSIFKEINQEINEINQLCGNIKEMIK